MENGDGQFADRLKKARKFRGLSVGQLAKLTNLSKSSLFHYEQNEREPTLRAFKALVVGLRIDPNYLLSQSDDFVENPAAFTPVSKLRNPKDSEAFEYLIERLLLLTDNKNS